VRHGLEARRVGAARPAIVRDAALSAHAGAGERHDIAVRLQEVDQEAQRLRSGTATAFFSCRVGTQQLDSLHGPLLHTSSEIGGTCGAYADNRGVVFGGCDGASGAGNGLEMKRPSTVIRSCISAPACCRPGAAAAGSASCRTSSASASAADAG